MDYRKNFEDLQADFYHYMVTYGGITPKTSRDYVTRLRFLSSSYRLDASITKEYIEHILEEEDERRQYRDVYPSKKSISDFSSGLRKFLAFIQSDYQKMYEDSVLSEVKAVENTKNLSATERETIIQARVGQGIFRKSLIDYWKGCAISQCTAVPLLIASHIKPWCVSDNQERIDPYNGLLLLPNYDKLFDLGYLSFKQNGKAVFSQCLSQKDKDLFGLKDDLALIHIEEAHKIYLKFHYDYCFIG